ncbi:unnamed protein product [Caenorhabditis bovis]|uniref:Uncharacterized protein n=1 Tax=Caenorhabditis bovis TaxID=2654633 RepID=A0A8S1FFA7_9PELO|nr:unnamed protein product [Caenorhabditis bovis]
MEPSAISEDSTKNGLGNQTVKVMSNTSDQKNVNKREKIQFDFDVESEQFLKCFNDKRSSDSADDDDDELRRLKDMFNRPYLLGYSFLPVPNLQTLSWPIPKSAKTAKGADKSSASSDFIDNMINPKISESSSSQLDFPSHLSLKWPKLSLGCPVAHKRKNINFVTSPSSLQQDSDPSGMTEELARLKALFKRPYFVDSDVIDDLRAQSSGSDEDVSGIEHRSEDTA